MREIKFRAWDNIGKKFLHPYPEGFHILGEVLCFDLLMSQMYDDHPENRPSLSMLNDVLITQFTGLKDKNGKEIYEGDIVHILEYLNGKIWNSDNHYGEIVFIKGMFDFTNAYNHQSLQQNEVIIIGNIYENPELMEK